MTPKYFGQDASHGMLAKLRAVIAPSQGGAWMWVESLAIPLTALGLALFSHPEDPFLLQSAFPWLWFAPVLVALRYGVSCGVLASIVLAISWFMLQQYYPVYQDFPSQYFLGGLILMMICGEFSSAWRVRLLHIEENNQYLDQRLARLTKRHLLLSLSHERMEQELLSKPVNLREAIVQLRELTFVQSANEVLPAAEALLALLTQYCQLESAAVLVLEKQECRRIALVGAAFELDADDPLVSYALQQRQLAHLLTQDLDVLPTQNLVAAPIISSDDQLLGVVVVNRMPFFALTTDILQMLSAILAYYADCITVSERANDLLRRFPAMPFEFAEEYVRMKRLQQQVQIVSHIVVLQCGAGAAGEMMAVRLMRIKRGLDLCWQCQVGGRVVLVMLLPLAGHAAVDGYLLRLELMLREQLGQEFDSAVLQPRCISLASHDSSAALAEVIQS